MAVAIDKSITKFEFLPSLNILVDRNAHVFLRSILIIFENGIW